MREKILSLKTQAAASQCYWPFTSMDDGSVHCGSRFLMTVQKLEITYMKKINKQDFKVSEPFCDYLIYQLVIQHSYNGFPADCFIKVNMPRHQAVLTSTQKRSFFKFLQKKKLPRLDKKRYQKVSTRIHPKNVQENSLKKRTSRGQKCPLEFTL